MNTDNWIPFYKYSDEGFRGMAQQTYEPLINPERTVLCANYNINNSYQFKYGPRPLYTLDVVDWFFENELKYMTKFKNKSYMPMLLDVDKINKKIFYEWNGYSLNELLFEGQDVEWKESIKNILLDLYKEDTYKLTMYPHCHFIDKHGVMKAIDWYGCVSASDPFIETKYMDGIIHETAIFRLKETGDIINEKYNLEIMFKQGLLQHVKWNNFSLEYIYKEIFKNDR